MDENRTPTRKQIRLKEYDYNSHGAYFITFCTKDRKSLLSRISVGTTIGRPPTVGLTKYGRLTEEAISNIPVHYPLVTVDKYVIMPNHVHMILFIHNDLGRAMLVPTVSRIVQQTKGYITKRIGYSIWQPRFYDHVIRNEADYRETWQYIDDNPAKWTLDKYYTI